MTTLVGTGHLWGKSDNLYIRHKEEKDNFYQYLRGQIKSTHFQITGQAKVLHNHMNERESKNKNK